MLLRAEKGLRLTFPGTMRIGKACNLEHFFLFSESEATPGVKM